MECDDIVEFIVAKLRESSGVLCLDGVTAEGFFFDQKSTALIRKFLPRNCELGANCVKIWLFAAARIVAVWWISG